MADALLDCRIHLAWREGEKNLGKNQNLMSGGEGFVSLWEDLKSVFLDQLHTARLSVDSKLWSSTTLTFLDVLAH